MWLRTLDTLECATIVSSIGTLAIAISSIYQMRISQRNTFFPILSIDDVRFERGQGLSLQLRNYGTGPALNVQIHVISKAEPASTLQVICHGHTQAVLHVATSEKKDVDLVGKLHHPERAHIEVRYECIRHRHFETSLALEPFVTENHSARYMPKRSAKRQPSD